jgi:Methyltransferase domain
MPEKIQVKRKKGIALAIISGRGLCPVDMVCSLAMQGFPPNTNFFLFPVYGQDVAEGRTQAVKNLRALGAKYVWFVDDDTVPPMDCGRHLAYLLDQNGPPFGKVMVAGAIYTSRSSPPEPLVFMEQGAGPHWDWKVGETFKCWGLGTGCMMINLELFDHLQEPWFATVTQSENRWTDDLYFSELVAQAGFEMMAHGGILCHHYDWEQGMVYQLPRNSHPYAQRISEPMEPKFALPAAANIGELSKLDLLPNPWMTPHETAWLIERARNAETFAEVGCWRGVTSRNIAKNSKVKLYAIDHFQGSEEHIHITSPHYEPRLKQEGWLLAEAYRNVDGLPVEIMNMTSTSAANRFAANELDVVFIDGAHDYQSVKADIEAWLPRVKKAGILCGHDFNWPEVNQAVTELLPTARAVPASSIWMYQKLE